MRLSFVQARVQHIVLHLFLMKKFGEQFGFLDGHGANQHWLSLVRMFLDRFGDRPELVMRILVKFVHRSEEHTSELQSLMRISYAVFCLKKKNTSSNKQYPY